MERTLNLNRFRLSVGYTLKVIKNPANHSVSTSLCSYLLSTVMATVACLCSLTSRLTAKKCCIMLDILFFEEH